MNCLVCHSFIFFQEILLLRTLQLVFKVRHGTRIKFSYSLISISVKRRSAIKKNGGSQRDLGKPAGFGKTGGIWDNRRDMGKLAGFGKTMTGFE